MLELKDKPEVCPCCGIEETLVFTQSRRPLFTPEGHAWLQVMCSETPKWVGKEEWKARREQGEEDPSGCGRYFIYPSTWFAPRLEPILDPPQYEPYDTFHTNVPPPYAEYARRGPPKDPGLYKTPIKTDALIKAEQWLSTHLPEKKGDGNYLAASQTAYCLIRLFNLSENDALFLFSWWNTYCEPHWTEDGLRSMITRAAAFCGKIKVKKKVESFE